MNPAMIPVLVLLSIPVAGVLYFIDMPKIGKPRITGRGAETEHSMDLRHLNPGRKRRVYLSPRTPVS